MSRDPLRDGISKIALIDSMGTDESVVRAARVSYAGDERTGVDKEGDAKLIRFLANNNHTSPFEHSSLTFYVKCPLFVRSQWHRHRTWSYNEISRRYTSEDIEFHFPDKFRLQSNYNKQGSHWFNILEPASNLYFNNYMRLMAEKSLVLYEEMLKEGVAREQARMVLPQNLYTQFYATVDLHNLSKFIHERSDEHAQYEIRVYSDAMKEIATELFPVSMGALCGNA